MAGQGWLKETIFEMKDDIKALSAKFNEFMQDRRTTCPTALEIDRTEKIRQKDDEARGKTRALRWTIIGVVSAVVLGLPGWIALLK